MGRVIACGIPQGAGQKDGGRGRACGIPQGTGHEESEEEKTQRNTAGNRTEQNAEIPQGTEQKRRNTGESRTKRKKNGWQKKSKIARMGTPIVRHGRIIVNLLYTC